MSDEGRKPMMADGAPWELLVRYGRGDLDASDVTTLRAWAANDDARQALLDGVARLGELSRRAAAGARVDAAWARVQPRVARDAGAPRVLRLESPPMAGMARYAGRRSWWRSLAVGLGVAATLATVAIGLPRVIEAWRTTEATVPLREAIAPRGGRTVLGLPDGTRVVLGPESRIRYAIADGAPARNVYLEGVARFDVAHDPSQPFVVHAAGGAAQAVGTAFGVRAYPGDSVLAVVVAEGRVALRTAGGRMGSGTMLEPGHRGLLSGDGIVRVEPNVDVSRALGWAEGRLAYDLVPLNAVLRDLERWFDVRITLADSTWQPVGVTVTLDAASADRSLRRLAALLGMKYTRSGREVRLGA